MVNQDGTTFQDRYYSELYHHGVKGMKWGVRKNKYQERAMIRRKADVRGKHRKAVKEELDRFVIEEGTLRRLHRQLLYGPDMDEDDAIFDSLIAHEKKLAREWMPKDFDAWMKDAKIKSLSEEGRKYAEKQLYTSLGYRINTPYMDDKFITDLGYNIDDIS